MVCMMGHYDEGYAIRAAWSELREHRGERRGRKVEIDDDQATQNYVELESRAVIVSRGKLIWLLADPRLRFIPNATQNNPDPIPKRLNDEDRARLRGRYRIGKSELNYWKAMRCHYCAPQLNRHPNDVGEPHPVYFDIMHMVDERVAELRADPSRLFLLTGFWE